MLKTLALGTVAALAITLAGSAASSARADEDIVDTSGAAGSFKTLAKVRSRVTMLST